jgi:hypothetical protein
VEHPSCNIGLSLRRHGYVDDFDSVIAQHFVEIAVHVLDAVAVGHGACSGDVEVDNADDVETCRPVGRQVRHVDNCASADDGDPASIRCRYVDPAGRRHGLEQVDHR